MQRRTAVRPVSKGMPEQRWVSGEYFGTIRVRDKRKRSGLLPGIQICYNKSSEITNDKELIK